MKGFRLYSRCERYENDPRAAKTEEDIIDLDYVTEYEMDLSIPKTSLAKTYEEKNEIKVTMQIPKSDYNNEGFVKIRKWANTPVQHDDYYRDLAVSYKAAGENYRTILFSHARITLRIHDETKHDFVTATIYAKQKEDQFVGVVLGKDLESAYAKAREKVANPPLLKLVSPRDSTVIVPGMIGTAGMVGSNTGFTAPISNTSGTTLNPADEAKVWFNGTKISPAYFYNGAIYISSVSANAHAASIGHSANLTGGAAGKPVSLKIGNELLPLEDFDTLSGKHVTQQVKLREFAAAVDREDCLSYWYESSVPHSTLNYDMKDGPVSLIRINNKVTISADFYFTGSLAKSQFLDEFDNVDPVGKIYETLAYEGIRDIWSSGTFNATSPYDLFGDDASVDVTFKFRKLVEKQSQTMPYLEVKIEEVGQAITTSNILWKIGKLGHGRALLPDIHLFRYGRNWKNQAKSMIGITVNKRYYNSDEFKMVAAHEFGHILGLGDAYDGDTQDPPPITAEIPQYEIMRCDYSQMDIVPNTIEMILEAFKLNSLQIYDPNSSNQSSVIRL